MTSVYPTPSEVLVDQVRALATELGAWPAKRQVIRDCKVGAPRAGAALDALRAEGFDPTTPARALTVVPDLPDAPETHSEHVRERTDDQPQTDEQAAADVPAEPVSEAAEIVADGLVGGAADAPGRTACSRVPRWPLLIIAAGAFVSIWGGWVGLGELAGFGPVRLLPGIADSFVINSAITLPLGVEAYAAFAMWTWLASPDMQVSDRARRFACWSSIADRTLELLDAVEHVITRDYMTSGEHAPTAEQEVALVKAQRLLARLVGQLDRAAGGDGCGVPDEEVPKVD